MALLKRWPLAPTVYYSETALSLLYCLNLLKLTTAKYNIHLPSAVSSHTVALLAWWATFCKITSAMYLPVRATEIAIHTDSNVHKVKLEQGTELCQWLHCNARSLLTLWPHELCVEWESTNTSKSTFIMWEFSAHTRSVQLKRMGNGNA